LRCHKMPTVAAQMRIAGNLVAAVISHH
jgi:hypothetical protein